VPKISYVKGFEPWGWVIGSGIYVDDVNAAFWQQARVFSVLAFIVIALIVVISYLVTRSILSQLGAEPYQVTDITRRVAAGDLSVDIESNGDKESLLAAEKEMVERLREIVNDIKIASESLASGSEQLSASSEQISRGMSEQSERAAQIASSTEEMSSVSENISSDIQSIAQSSKETTVGSDHIAAASLELASLAGKLKDVISRFKV